MKVRFMEPSRRPLMLVVLALLVTAILLAMLVQAIAWANSDGGRTVDIVAIQRLAARWGESASWPDDTDGDGIITASDIQWWASLWERLPSVSEEPIVGWATGSEGVLLRWRWSHSARPPSGYRVYRDGSLLTTVERVTDEAQAIAILGSHWPWLQSTYSVTTIAELHVFLDDNPLAELWLADQRYPVALIRGLGYLDDTAAEGSEHTYRVAALLPAGEMTVGEVTIVHKGITPLDAPTGLTAVQVVSDTLRGAADWARAQKNRKANSKVFLRWDLPTGSGGPEAWISAYDVFRSATPAGPYARINVEDGEDRPVVPMADYDPPAPVEGDPYTSVPYEHHNYYYADADPTLQACQSYYYRVAPRDLLGRPRDWSDPVQQGQFSDYVEAVPPDTMPPAAPFSVTATSNYTTGVITVTWHPVTDAVRYHVYRSTTVNAAWPGASECVTCTQWVTMTTTAGTSWVDTSAAYEQRYWYVVRAEDAPCGGDPPNLSAPSQPVSAILHDRVPPKKCSVEGSSRQSTIWVDCDSDTADILLFCRFDGGPELLVTQERSRNLVYDLSKFYTPAKPIKADCRAVAVDEHGNRSLPSNWVSGLPLAPPTVPDPSPPILWEAKTEEGGTYGWTAHLYWDAIPAACLSGFRVYRESPGVSEALIADESILGVGKREYEDTQVRWGTVYTYTVAAYRKASDCGPAKEVRSQPLAYRVTQPPEYPGRSVDPLAWGSNSYDSQGTHLSWYSQEIHPLYVVFRSLQEDRGYVAITPPIQDAHYLDADAHHANYWYMVLALDPVTGEPFAATTAWSAGASEASQQVVWSVSLLSSGGAEGEKTKVGSKIFATLPPVLYFGDGFELHVSKYYSGSTLGDLNGEGTLYLSPYNQLLLRIDLTFSHLEAKANGTITGGSITVPGSALPIVMHDPILGRGKFHYEVLSLTVDKNGGQGDVTIYLPSSVYYHYILPFPYLEILSDHITLNNVTIHPSLYFQRVTSSTLTCAESTSTYYRLEDLPWRIIPSGTVTYTQSSIAFESACALYEDRFNGTRPGYPAPDANDGLLRPRYDSSNAAIGPQGLSGTFSTTEIARYSMPFPYDFWLMIYQPTLILTDGFITGGSAAAGADHNMTFRYFQHVAEADPYHPALPLDVPEGQWQGDLSEVDIGPGGSIYAVAQQSGITDDISWLNEGFVLHDQRYELFIPPLQSTRLPWQDALWPTEEHRWEDGTTLEPGLNLRTPTGENAHLEWNDCSTTGPITFPDGVQADLYLRRAGISDLLQATIPLGSPMSVELDGYKTQLQSFMLVFFDNTLYDRDISGSFDLPGPTNALIPFAEVNLDGNGCIDRAQVNAVTIKPAYWQVTMHPSALEFRPPDPDPSAPGERGLWLIGEVDIPHLLALSDGVTATVSLETAFKPNGDFYAMTLQYDEVNYTLDGFSYLLSSIRLSDWATVEVPGWDSDANASDPPSCCMYSGFIELNGNLVTPYFGPLVGKDTGEPPQIFVLGWDHYVGFSERPRAERNWTATNDIDWRFDLTYAQHPTQTVAIFAGYGADVALRVLTLDNGTIIKPQTTEVFLGLASGSAVLKAIAETTIKEDITWEEFSTGGWVDVVRGKLSIPETYVTVLGQFFAKYNGIAKKINQQVGENGPDWLHQWLGGTFTLPVGGQAMDNIGNFLVNLSDMRGEMAFDAVMEGDQIVDYELAALKIHTWFAVGKYVKAKSIEFEINRDGDYILLGKGITSSMLEYDKLKIDFAIAINVDEPSVEAGLMLHNLKVDPVTFKNVGAALGAGSDILYLGALADVKYQGIALGGAFLFGKIDPNSIVLKSMGFSDLLDNLGATGLAEGTILAGFYIRVYGDVPIYNYSCLFRVSAGGEVALWYFAEAGGGADAYGGRLRGYVYGRILCVVSARGDLTLAIYHRADREGASMLGQFWVAGGIGFCEPEKWRSWDSRWWGDSWCWTCGAMIQASYNDSVPDDWSWDYDADYE